MPAWSWVVIWGALVLALVVVCVVLGRPVLRKFRAAVDASEQLAVVSGSLLSAAEELGAAGERLEERQRAVFGDVDALSTAWARRRAARAYRRQSRRDARIRRGRLITHSTQNWTS
ncbi:MAG: hypothetical protein ABWX82_07105 [Leifsonia sp.]